MTCPEACVGQQHVSFLLSAAICFCTVLKFFMLYVETLFSLLVCTACLQVETFS